MPLPSVDFAYLFDTAPDAIVIVDEEGLIQLVNRQTEGVFGYERTELLGKPLDMLIPDRFRSTHGAHMRRYFAHPDARPMGSGLQLFGRRKDGREIPIEVSLSPQKGPSGSTVSAAIRDISDRKRLEEEARLNAARLESAVDSMEDAFALFDADDRLVLCNSAFRRLVHAQSPESLRGATYESVLDAWIDDIALPDQEARGRFRQERLRQRKETQAVGFEARMKDGRRLRIVDRRTPEGGIVKTIWDLTLEEHRAEELREARTTAESASAAKSEFLSSMSHELRTPLNAILGFAQLLRRDKKEPLSDRHRDRVTQILTGGEHLLRLIDDILDLSRIEAGRVAISIEPVEVADVLDEALRTLEPLAARDAIVLEKDDMPSDMVVNADRTRFAQILMNLGSNAVKYNRPAGRVRFAVSVHGERVRVTVRDTGIGVPIDKQDKLFQPFQRAGQETGPIEGTGIGLVITKRLAEMMGGTVGFESNPGVGSSFWVEMPRHEEGATSVRRIAAEDTNRSPRIAPGNRMILYVEDNPANVVFMKDLASTIEDVDLVTVPSAELGVHLARARQPDVIVMDINLPGMSGFDALEALRADPETARIPVIALTAAASDRDRERGQKAGFYRYLTKPVKVDELIDALEKLLSGGNHESKT